MKRCPRCKLELSLDRFGPRGNGLQSYCKSCKVKWDKEYYATNNTRRLSVRKTNHRILKRNRTYIWSYLCDHPCVECNEVDPVVLDFHHVRDTKVQGVFVLAGNLASLERIKTEIAKCEVRCCNCHRRTTAQKSGWWTTARDGIPSV